MSRDLLRTDNTGSVLLLLLVLTGFNMRGARQWRPKYSVAPATGVPSCRAMTVPARDLNDSHLIKQASMAVLHDTRDLKPQYDFPLSSSESLSLGADTQCQYDANRALLQEIPF